MFRKGWQTSSTTMNSEYYSEHSVIYGTLYHAGINISVTYTIGYGKKVQRGNEVGEQSGTSSGIMK